MFKHYLITRFNLRNKEWKTTKNREPLVDTNWLDHRIRLFKNFCLPSVLNQTNQSFTWLIYFDAKTPLKYRKIIQSLLGEQENIEFFFIDGMKAFYPALTKKIQHETQDVSHVITSRIDNDDCLSKYYIDTIQSFFDNQNFTVIDSISGYTLQISPTFRLGKKEHIFNPFLSLIEKNENPKTIWVRNHASWKKEKDILQIKGKRLWMSIIHDKNVANRFDGYGKVRWEDISDDFIVSEGMNITIKEELVTDRRYGFQSIFNFIDTYFTIYTKTLKRKLGFYNR
ncbi:MAG: hypothetical protein JG782_1728 [Anaerophaga sp.]|nr:hypothetical protein [Anaerophaga sp.]MDK2842359.1 hypothetical protein [Anaerophaga sp.]